MDLGCGMGYFSLPMASLGGEFGRVIAVDLQPQMLAGLKHRAEKNNLLERIKLHQCSQDQIGIPGPVDFVLAFWMVHEVHNSVAFLEQIQECIIAILTKADKSLYLGIDEHLGAQHTRESRRIQRGAVNRNP